MRDNKKQMHSPSWRRSRGFAVSLFQILVMMASFPVMGVPYLPSWLRESASDGGERATFAAIVLWLVFMFLWLWWMRRTMDPMASKLSHADLMIPAMRELVFRYERDRRDVILAKFDRAGELGFMGGVESFKFGVARAGVVNLGKHTQKNIKEVERFRTVRPQYKLRFKYYHVEDLIAGVERLETRAEKFLLNKGVDPDELNVKL